MNATDKIKLHSKAKVEKYGSHKRGGYTMCLKHDPLNDPFMTHWIAQVYNIYDLIEEEIKTVEGE